MLDDNRKLFERNRNNGGTRYPVSAIMFQEEDWLLHFGRTWRQLVNAKRRYDPTNILTPGQGIFTRRKKT